MPLENASRVAAKVEEAVEADTAVAMGELFGSMSHRINTEHQTPRASCCRCLPARARPGEIVSPAGWDMQD